MEYHEGHRRDRGAPGSTDWIERLLAQAILASSTSREEMPQARLTRAEAERCRQEAEAEAAKAMEETFSTVKAQAQRILEEAAAIRAEAEADRAEASHELERATAVRQEAESYSRRVEEEAEEIRWRIGEEMQKIMKDVASLRSAAQEEIEAQRLLTEAARIRALGPTLRTQLSADSVPATRANGHGSALTAEVVSQAAARGRGRHRKDEAEGGEAA